MVDLEKMPRGLIDIRTSELSKADIVSAIVKFSLAATFVMISMFVIMILAKVMNSKGFRFNKLIVTALGTIYAILLVIAGRGAGLFAVKGFFLFAVLLYASCSDITTNEVDDSMWVIITALSFINPLSPASMFLGATTVFLPMFLIAITNKRSFGGADIKIATAIAFLLGIERGIAAVFLGMVFAVVFMAAYRMRHRERRGEPFALVPFLSAGALIVFLI